MEELCRCDEPPLGSILSSILQYNKTFSINLGLHHWCLTFPQHWVGIPDFRISAFTENLCMAQVRSILWCNIERIYLKRDKAGITCSQRHLSSTKPHCTFPCRSLLFLSTIDYIVDAWNDQRVDEEMQTQLQNLTRSTLNRSSQTFVCFKREKLCMIFVTRWN